MSKLKLGRMTLAASASLIALAVGQPSWAQDAAAPADGAADASNDVTVVVTARRKALQTATERKKNSDTMIESIVADDAGKLPDNSITEVLQRVSGVTMVRFAALNDPDHFSAEGSGIQVRGLSGVTGTLNGREVFSANGGGGLSWGDVTPELMAAVDVYKANRADMIEGGTGGSIDLRTKMPFDYRKPAIEAAIGASYGDYSKETTPSASVLLTNRWDTPIGEIGLLVDAATSKYSAADSFIRTEPYLARVLDGETRYIPAGFDWGDDQFNRTRTGLYEAAQWRPNDSLTFYQTFFESRYKSDNTSAGAFFANRGNGTSDMGFVPLSDGNPVYDSNGALISSSHIGIGSSGANGGGETVSQGWIPAENQVDCNAPYGAQPSSLQWTTSPDINNNFPYCLPATFNIGSNRGFTTSDNVTRDFSQGFLWYPNERTQVKADLQFVDSSSHSTTYGVGLHAPGAAFSMDLSGDLPSFTIVNQESLENSGIYGWDNIAYRTQNNHGTMGALTLDVSYDLGDGFFKQLKVGGRYANRVERDNYDGTYWAALGMGWNNSDQRTLADGAAADSELYKFDNFFRGDVALPGHFYFPSVALMKAQDALYVQNTYGYSDENIGAVPLANVFHDPFGAARTQVITKSIYVQAKFGSDEGLFGIPFDGNIGLRVVRNEVTATGFFKYNDANFYMTQAESDADLADDGIENNYYHTDVTGYEAKDGLSYTKYLPSINITFKPSSKLYVRFAANETMSPAGYNDLRVTGSASVSTNPNANNVPDNPSTPDVDESVTYRGILSGLSSSAGNPHLRPTDSRNLDLSVEWYPSNSFNGHIDLFYKDLKDLIVYGDTTKPFIATYERMDGTTTSDDTTLTATEVFNSDKDARVQGLEIGGRKFFDELPAPFNGLGIEANYTYIDSKNPGAKALGVDGQPINDVPIVGMSKENYNIQLMYERKNLSMRLAYSWRSKYLQSTNANGTNGNYMFVNGPGATPQQLDIGLPVYGSAYGQLDAGINYTVNSHVKVWLQANNITNAVTKTQMEILPGKFYTRSWFVYDQRINVGVNLAF